MTMQKNQGPSPGSLVDIVPTYYVNTTLGHNKFWEILIENEVLTTRYGRIGSCGSQTQKAYSTMNLAARERDLIVRTKLAKGYKSAIGGHVKHRCALLVAFVDSVALCLVGQQLLRVHASNVIES